MVTVPDVVAVFIFSTAPPDFVAIVGPTSAADEAIGEGAIHARFLRTGAASAGQFALDALVGGRVYNGFV